MMRSLAIVPAGLLLLLLASCTNRRIFHGSPAPSPPSPRSPRSLIRSRNLFIRDNGFIVLMEDRDYLLAGTSLTGAAGIRLTQEMNGNLVLYQDAHVLWESGKNENESDGKYFTILQREGGNFISWRGTTEEKEGIIWEAQVTGQSDDYFFALSTDLKKVSVNRGLPSNMLEEMWSEATMISPALTPMPTYLPPLSTFVSMAISSSRPSPSRLDSSPRPRPRPTPTQSSPLTPLPTPTSSPAPSPTTTSAPTPELYVPPTRHNIELHPMMMENTKISVGEHIGIPLGSYNVQLTQELDGNFVLCLGTNGNCGDILWQSGYHGSDDNKYYTRFQSNGNLITRNGNRNVVWKVTDASGLSRDEFMLAYIPETSGLASFQVTDELLKEVLWSSHDFDYGDYIGTFDEGNANSEGKSNSVDKENSDDEFVLGKLVQHPSYGLYISQGLNVKIFASADEPVHLDSLEASNKYSDIPFHGDPDGATCLTLPGGEWAYVSNSELGNNKGGVFSVIFDKFGKAKDYIPVLQGTSRNCAGGKTPWNTWISCEEDTDGQCFQVYANNETRWQTNLGGDGGRFEAFAYDDRNKSDPVFFITEDDTNGALRRVRPMQHIDVGPGILHGNDTDIERTYLVFTSDDTFEWSTNLTLGRESAELYFPNCEGIDRRDNILYFISKMTKQLYTLDLDNMTYMIQSTNVSNRLFRAKPDNVHAIGDTNGVLYFTEDGSKTPGLFVRDSFGTYLTFFHAYTRNYDGDEATGAAFSPDMKTLYCCLQEEGNCFAFTRKDGLTFEGGPTLKIRQDQSGPPEP